MAASRSKFRATRATTLRHAWLAGLGLVAVTRREVLAAPTRLAAGAGDLRSRSQVLIDGLRSRVQGQVEAKVVRFSSEVEARLAPVLEKLGLKKARRPARKTKKGGKPQSRRTTASRRSDARAVEAPPAISRGRRASVC